MALVISVTADVALLFCLWYAPRSMVRSKFVWYACGTLQVLWYAFNLLLKKCGKMRQRAAKSGKMRQSAAKSGKMRQRAAKCGKERSMVRSKFVCYAPISYGTRMVRSKVNGTLQVLWYAYGTLHVRMVRSKFVWYAYGTLQCLWYAPS